MTVRKIAVRKIAVRKIAVRATTVDLKVGSHFWQRQHGVCVTILLALIVVAGCQPPPPVIGPSSVERSSVVEASASILDSLADAGAAVVRTAIVEAPSTVASNPPAPGFDLAGSDTRAIEIADRVMTQLGGRANWDATRYITWRFFGNRRHVWDKWTGALRFEEGDLLVLMNLNDHQGCSWRDGVAVENTDSLAAHVEGAYRAWVNDSYWLVMPYKLKDTGVTLRYIGQEMTNAGLPAHVLDLTFRDVGVTPHNRYRVWVDSHESVVRQWAFYTQASDTEPRFVLPWKGWRSYGNIRLAHDFGRSRHTQVAVFDELPTAVFSDPAPQSFFVTD